MMMIDDDDDDDDDDQYIWPNKNDRELHVGRLAINVVAQFSPGQLVTKKSNRQFSSKIKYGQFGTRTT